MILLMIHSTVSQTLFNYNYTDSDNGKFGGGNGVGKNQLTLDDWQIIASSFGINDDVVFDDEGSSIKN